MLNSIIIIMGVWLISFSIYYNSHNLKTHPYQSLMFKSHYSIGNIQF